MKKVLVGMSGGVDSAVAASLLLETGYDVLGATLILTDSSISNKKIIEDAKNVATILGINHVTIDLKKEFKEKVINYFTHEYLIGRTPNPCVVCNSNIKFGLMIDKALELNFNYLATGHYAKIIYNKSTKRWLLQKNNSKKDQSYFLHRLTQNQLSHALFPLAKFEKSEIRAIAEKYNLPVANKKESQDICFVKEGNHTEFIENYTNIKSTPGNFVDSEKNILGMHKGITYYTIGQRRHLGISLGKHMYVMHINSNQNEIVLGEHSEGLCSSLIVENVNYITYENLKSEINAFVKIRARASSVPCKIIPLTDNSVKVIFSEPQFFPAPGQCAVFYDEKGYVLGGGFIK